jgi:hypothetical protein
VVIDHPKRDEILTELSRRIRVVGMSIYLIELLKDRELGWDARYKAVGDKQQRYELGFLRVQEMRDEYWSGCPTSSPR